MDKQNQSIEQLDLGQQLSQELDGALIFYHKLKSTKPLTLK